MLDPRLLALANDCRERAEGILAAETFNDAGARKEMRRIAARARHYLRCSTGRLGISEARPVAGSEPACHLD
jgi:hypothetical protein